VMNFVNKFRIDPTGGGINYETLGGVKDKNLKSVRIDKNYRGIVYKPKKGNVYLLLWVDSHDEAYRWARNRVCEVNPKLGILQVYRVDEQQTQLEHKPVETATLFSNLRDRELLKLGVPEKQIDMVRSITTEKELNNLQDAFPGNVFVALTWLAQGETYEEVIKTLNEFGGEPEEKVDTQDFTKALAHPVSRQHFQVDPSEEALTKMLHAPLEKWRVFLHPLQRKLVERNWNGPVRVLGGAGTGKTVVAMHRAAWLSSRLAGQDKILFTTFTRNLATDIEVNLKKIMPSDQMHLIEVVNLDRWVVGFLKKHGYDHTIVYDDRTQDLWETALTLKPDTPVLPDEFYRQEWAQVIQPQEITSFVQYAKAKRTGRGIRLNRKERKDIWQVFEEYQMLLAEKNYRERADAMRDARQLIEKENIVLPYVSIIVDEAQDMGMQAFKLLRSMVPESANDLLIVGDAHQRIYDKKVVLGQCGIKIIGRSHKLKINYRTTEETRKWAVSLMKGITVDDLDGGDDSLGGYVSLMHGVAPLVEHYDSFNDEISTICAHLNEIRKEDEQYRSTCLVARTNKQLNEYEARLEAAGIPVYRLSGFDPEDRSRGGVRLATMHRVKGLEFDHLALCGINKGIVPMNTPDLNSDDSTVRRMAEARERSLLFVAATRAKKSVMVTSYGTKSDYL
ncbi:MAG TPA: UvrD-helicase domain-containing protein, partial [Desulfobacter sp.]|nr:UvrD-helicase domain-containing protein [Desulfobacter sp.]